MKLWEDKQRLPSALLTGLFYGILLGVFGAAAIGFLGTCISPMYSQHPLDRMAYGIIMAVSAVAFLAIMLADSLKNGEEFSFKRGLIQFGVAAATVLVLFAPIWMVMEYCEGVLGRLVP